MKLKHIVRTNTRNWKTNCFTLKSIKDAKTSDFMISKRSREKKRTLSPFSTKTNIAHLVGGRRTNRVPTRAQSGKIGETANQGL